MNAPFLRILAAQPLRAALTFAAIGACAGLLCAAALPKTARVSMAFTIAEQARQETADYAYDGYYSLQASNLIADTLISWLATPSVIKDIHADAGVPISDDAAFAEAGRAFRAKKYSSQNVVVTFAAADAGAAAKLAASTDRILSDRAARLVLSSKDQPQFSVAASDPVIAERSLPPVASGLAGLAVGAFLGLAFAYAMKERKSPQP